MVHRMHLGGSPEIGFHYYDGNWKHALCFTELEVMYIFAFMNKYVFLIKIYIANSKICGETGHLYMCIISSRNQKALPFPFL